MPVKRLGAVTGREYFGGSLAEYASTGVLGRIARRANVSLPPLSEVSTAAPLTAWLQEDRWVAVCPDCGRNAQLVWEETPLYLCCACWNAAVGGTWRRVVWPKERKAIERIVGMRHLAANRNWQPGESLNLLRAENIEHGLPAEEGN